MVFLKLGERTLTFLLVFFDKIASLPYIFSWSIIPNWLEVLILYGLLFTIFSKLPKKKYILIFFVTLLLLDISYYTYKHYQKRFNVSFFNVSGTSILLRFPYGKTMLIGGGGSPFSSYDPGRTVVAKALWAQKIGRLDYLVLPTPHYSYLKGLIFIKKHFHPKYLWTNGMKVNDTHYWNLFYLCSETNILIQVPKTQEINGVRVEVLYPKKTQGLSLKDGLILKCYYKEISFLFTFYIKAKTIKRLAPFLKADVLLAPNYGSKAVNSSYFIQLIKPKYVVFLGRRPSPEVIKNYLIAGSKLFFTKEDGFINFITDGHNLEVKTFHSQTKNTSFFKIKRVV
jgi:competence protein ComEC